MGESGKPLAQTRWVAFAALVVAIVALFLAGYATFMAQGNARDITDVVKAIPGK